MQAYVIPFSRLQPYTRRRRSKAMLQNAQGHDSRLTDGKSPSLSLVFMRAGHGKRALFHTGARSEQPKWLLMSALKHRIKTFLELLLRADVELHIVDLLQLLRHLGDEIEVHVPCPLPPVLRLRCVGPFELRSALVEIRCELLQLGIAPVQLVCNLLDLDVVLGSDSIDLRLASLETRKVVIRLDGESAEDILPPLINQGLALV